MQKKFSQEYFIPVIDCLCGRKDVVLTTEGPWCKEGVKDLYISYCPHCERVPYDESEIKGYLSLGEFEALGFVEGL